MSIVGAFNTHFKEMCEDILQIYPDDWNIKKAYNGVQLMQKVKPSMIISLWKKITLLFKDKIEAEGLSFYLNYAYENDPMIQAYPPLLTALIQFRDSVSKMDVENQEKVYEYICNLTKISHMNS